MIVSNQYANSFAIEKQPKNGITYYYLVMESLSPDRNIRNITTTEITAICSLQKWHTIQPPVVHDTANHTSTVLRRMITKVGSHHHSNAATNKSVNLLNKRNTSISPANHQTVLHPDI